MKFGNQGEFMNELVQLQNSPVTADTPGLTELEIGQLIMKLPGWETHKKKGELRLEKSFQFEDFSQALTFTNRVGKLANEEDHHPALTLSYNKVRVSLTTHEAEGLSENDFVMAGIFDGLGY